MGREIRRVVPNWEHPKVKLNKFNPLNSQGEEEVYQPLFDESYREAAQEWRQALAAWEDGERAAYFADTGQDYEYWDYNGMPPDKDYYRPDWKPEDMTWFQMYETVSEGTPVTPPFATKAELVDYLVANGDFWDQERGDGGWARENAEAFVEREWAPTGVIRIDKEGDVIGEFRTPRDGMP